MYFQLLNLLLLWGLFPDSEKKKEIIIPATKAIARDNTVRFDLPKSWTERMRTEFSFRTFRISNQLPWEVDFFSPIRLKRRLSHFLWSYFKWDYKELDPCTRKLACDSDVQTKMKILNERVRPPASGVANYGVAETALPITIETAEKATKQEWISAKRAPQ